MDRIQTYLFPTTTTIMYFRNAYENENNYR